jgi:membrane protease YdiL (CAAX protease family)
MANSETLPGDPDPRPDDAVVAGRDDVLDALPVEDSRLADDLDDWGPRSPRSFARQPRPHPPFWWALLWCIGFLVITQFGGAIVTLIALAGYFVAVPGSWDPEALTDTTSFLTSPAMTFATAVGFLFTELLVVGVSLLAIRVVVGRGWTRQLALRRPGLAHLPLVLAGFPGLVLLGDGSYALLKWLGGPSISDLGLPGMEQMVNVFSSWPPVFAVLVIGLGPGVGEELWCRGFLGRGLVGRHGVVLGVLASAFFFGLIHVDPLQGTMAMLMGLWLHFVYLTTRSLWMPMLLHFLNNSVAVLASRIVWLNTVSDSNGNLPWHLYLAGGGLLLTTGYALFQSRARLQAAEGSAAPAWQPAYPGVEYPPADSATQVVHPWPSLLAVAVALAGVAAFAVSWYLVPRA